MTASDVAIVDISAMVYDRLATGKPLLVTRPADDQALIDTHGYLGDCEWLDAESCSDIAAQATRIMADDDALDRLDHWVTHYFGDTMPGVATAKFRTAIERLMTDWNTWNAAEADDGASPFSASP